MNADFEEHTEGGDQDAYLPGLYRKVCGTTDHEPSEKNRCNTIAAMAKDRCRQHVHHTTNRFSSEEWKTTEKDSGYLRYGCETVYEEVGEPVLASLLRNALDERTEGHMTGGARVKDPQRKRGDFHYKVYKERGFNMLPTRILANRGVHKRVLEFFLRLTTQKAE